MLYKGIITVCRAANYDHVASQSTVSVVGELKQLVKTVFC